MLGVRRAFKRCSTAQAKASKEGKGLFRKGLLGGCSETGPCTKGGDVERSPSKS